MYLKPLILVFWRLLFKSFHIAFFCASFILISLKYKIFMKKTNLWAFANYYYFPGNFFWFIVFSQISKKHIEENSNNLFLSICKDLNNEYQHLSLYYSLIKIHITIQMPNAQYIQPRSCSPNPIWYYFYYLRFY